MPRLLRYLTANYFTTLDAYIHTFHINYKYFFMIITATANWLVVITGNSPSYVQGCDLHQS